MNFQKLLERIFKEKGVLSVEFLGLDVIIVSVKTASGEAPVAIDIYLPKNSVDSIVEVVRETVTNG